MKKISILGSTGSIGESALSLIDLYPDQFEIGALAAGKNSQRLFEQTVKYRPDTVALHDPDEADLLRSRLPHTRVLGGLEGVLEVAAAGDAEVIVAGISGAAGLLPTYHAILAGKTVALANKETLVMAGPLIMKAAGEHGATLVPVDSEHSALHQCLQGARIEEVSRLILTASGGPFFGQPDRDLSAVSVDEALAHPTWQMGPKITVDSATLMNKGLEVIEAHHLFGVAAGRLSIIIHPQSVIHSMVEFVDGTILAQMSVTDMRTAILYALTFPARRPSSLPGLNLASVAALEFHAPDLERFPCIRLAYQALESGGTVPAALNAANEIAVAAFLDNKIRLTHIPEIIERVMQRHDSTEVEDLDSLLEVDRAARRAATEHLRGLSG